MKFDTFLNVFYFQNWFVPQRDPASYSKTPLSLFFAPDLRASQLLSLFFYLRCFIEILQFRGLIECYKWTAFSCLIFLYFFLFFSFDHHPEISKTLQKLWWSRKIDGRWIEMKENNNKKTDPEETFFSFHLISVQKIFLNPSKHWEIKRRTLIFRALYSIEIIHIIKIMGEGWAHFQFSSK